MWNESGEKLETDVLPYWKTKARLIEGRKAMLRWLRRLLSGFARDVVKIQEMEQIYCPNDNEVCYLS